MPIYANENGSLSNITDQNWFNRILSVKLTSMTMIYSPATFVTNLLINSYREWGTVTPAASTTDGIRVVMTPIYNIYFDHTPSFILINVNEGDPNANPDGSPTTIPNVIKYISNTTPADLDYYRNISILGTNDKWYKISQGQFLTDTDDKFSEFINVKCTAAPSSMGDISGHYAYQKGASDSNGMGAGYLLTGDRVRVYQLFRLDRMFTKEQAQQVLSAESTTTGNKVVRNVNIITFP